jgi:leucyl-tRNA synthetase
MVAPPAPHIAEELWERLGKPYSVHTQSWPAFDPALAEDELVTIVVQVNGKLRERLSVPAGAERTEVEQLARESAKVAPLLNGNVRQVVYVPGRLLNFVVG